MLHLHLLSPTPESVESGDGIPTREWVLVSMVDSSQLGSPERLKLKNMKQKYIEHGMIIVYLLLNSISLCCKVNITVAVYQNGHDFYMQAAFPCHLYNDVTASTKT